MNLRTSAAARKARGLYLITPERPDTAQLLEEVAPLLAAGVHWLQYRHKSAPAGLRLDQARALQGLCERAGVPLIINDDPLLAAEVGAAGVHLGEDDGDIAVARSIVGRDAIVGASCYDSIDLARAAVHEGADYVAFGAFFPTRSKATTRRAPPALLHAASALGVPMVAIGGITPDNATTLVRAGADLLAVISGVFDAGDPVEAVRAYLRCFQNPDPAPVEAA